MMVGTAEEAVKAPEKNTVFMEDLPEDQQVVAVVSGIGHSCGIDDCGILRP